MESKPFFWKIKFSPSLHKSSARFFPILEDRQFSTPLYLRPNCLNFCVRMLGWCGVQSHGCNCRTAKNVLYRLRVLDHCPDRIASQHGEKVCSYFLANLLLKYQGKNSFFPSIKCNDPGPATENVPHTITDAPQCSTVGFRFLSFSSSLGFLQTYGFPSDPKALICLLNDGFFELLYHLNSPHEVHSLWLTHWTFFLAT